MDELTSSRRNIFFRAALNNIVWIILFICILTFSLTIQGFDSLRNYINIAYHSVFIGMLAIAESYCLISGNLDLSVESIAAFSAIFSTWLCAKDNLASGLNLNPFLTLIIVILIGSIVGIINGLLIVKLKINAFLATLSMYIMVRGAALFLVQGRGMSQLQDSFRFVDTFKLLDMPLMVYIMLLSFIFFWVILEYTRFGKHIFIIGGNINAAYNFGIAVEKTIFMVFIFSGAIAGLTGWLIAARTNGATPGIAQGYLFEVLAAVVIGGISLTGGIGSIAGVFAGVLLLSSIHSALNMLAISPFATDLIRGSLVFIAIILDSLKRMFKR